MHQVELSHELFTALKDLLSQVTTEGEHLLLTRQGKAVAALIPVEDLELLHTVEDRVEGQMAADALDESADRIPYDPGRQEGTR
jgi:PHD/YefM family antitoxin component YafN of YafNO toxin-antitoxin module